MEVEGPILNVGSTSPQTGAPAWVRRQAEQRHLSDWVQCDQLPRAPAAGTPPAFEVCTLKSRDTKGPPQSRFC